MGRVDENEWVMDTEESRTKGTTKKEKPANRKKTRMKVETNNSTKLQNGSVLYKD